MAAGHMLGCTAVQALSSVLSCQHSDVLASVLACLHSLAMTGAALPAFTANVISEVSHTGSLDLPCIFDCMCQSSLLLG